MKKLILFAALLFPALSAVSHAQGVRWDLGAPGGSGVTMVTGGSGYPPIFAVPNVSIAFCSHPAVLAGGAGTPCTNLVTTYTDLTLATACSTSTQIVLQGTSACVATSDSAGDLGLNLAAAGTYDYTLTVNGVTSNVYTVSIGNNGTSGTGTVTSVACGTGLTCSPSPITTAGTASLANTAVTPGNYTNTNLTVDQQGRITAASNGSGGSGVTGSGTAGYYANWTGSSSIGNSNLFDITSPANGVQYTTGSGLYFQVLANGINFYAGTGSGGTAISIGNSYNTGANNGASTTIFGQPSGGNACGGNVIVNGGQSSTFTTGYASLNLGGGCSNGIGSTGSNVSLTGGAAAVQLGGNANVTGGAGGGGNGGGNANLTGGTNTGTGTGAGGNANVTGGASSTNSVAGGNANITGGQGNPGGDVILKGGATAGGTGGGVGKVQAQSVLLITTTTYSGLPSCASGLNGASRPITDSTVNTVGSTISGSGSYAVTAYCNGSNWVVGQGGTSSGGGTTTNALTMNNSGSGVASGGTFNGSAAVTLSYNTLGAAPTASPTFTGTVTEPDGTTNTSSGYTFAHALNLPTGSTLNSVAFAATATSTTAATGLNGTSLASATGILRMASGTPSASELSGDVTTSGSNATTLATVNSSPGTTAPIASVTVNAKGLVTATAAGIANTTITVGNSGSSTSWTANSCLNATGGSGNSTVSMTNLATTSVVMFEATIDTAAVPGFGTSGGLIIKSYPSGAGTLTYGVCNQSGSTISWTSSTGTSGTVTFNVGAR